MEPILSVVIPVHNERENIVSLLKEIDAVLQTRISYEIVVVDDKSSDQSLEALKQCKLKHNNLRILSHNMHCGQSSAIRTGILAAVGELVVTLDGDGQNDPADITKLLHCYDKTFTSKGPAMIAGYRHPRRDSLGKQIASHAANTIRHWMMKDKAIDSGCGLKLFLRESFLRLPYFDNMHRYLPALMLREGYHVEFVEVSHRPRLYGKSNYGVLDRLLVAFSDVLGMMWLKRRCSLPDKLSEH